MQGRPAVAGGGSAAASDPSGSSVVGVLADPETAPVDVATQLAADLPDVLRTTVGDGRTWSAEVLRNACPRLATTRGALIRAAAEQMADRGWAYAVAVTDLPLRAGQRPVVADLDRGRGVMGGVAARVRGDVAAGGCHAVVRQLVTELVGTRRTLPTSVITVVRYGCQVSCVASGQRSRASTCGWSRHAAGCGLLVGTVRDNRPWRLVLRTSTRATGSRAGVSVLVLAVLAPGRLRRA